jgi:hypothetical protein
LAFGATFYFIKYFTFSTQKLLSEHGFVGRIFRFQRWFDVCSSDFQIELRHLFFVIFFAWPLFWLIFKQLGYFFASKIQLLSITLDLSKKIFCLHRKTQKPTEELEHYKETSHE